MNRIAAILSNAIVLLLIMAIVGNVSAARCDHDFKTPQCALRRPNQLPVYIPTHLDHEGNFYCGSGYTEECCGMDSDGPHCYGAN
ncbi:hypothetical protein PGT21_006662 [Puccinia graminis f. sp. tritici]|uniref:Uncharacterized protein n=1 Tax=Puccinia graminis f. sp. tritici TaxID=56615 RepID=A0A5B0MTA1_PUCGR|nr:hypothetical protein PGT21_006662 [Puccinia graminis f. sp. tritici]